SEPEVVKVVGDGGHERFNSGSSCSITFYKGFLWSYADCCWDFSNIYVPLHLTLHTVALVRESGSGKSTVLSLLQRFYDPDSGNITIDGINIQNIKLKWLMRQMGLVSQEPVLFNDSIILNNSRSLSCFDNPHQS
ncbi:hypothetical protein POM88_018340, partial [Heracleum sosnowskyi]